MATAGRPQGGTPAPWQQDYGGSLLVQAYYAEAALFRAADKLTAALGTERAARNMLAAMRMYERRR